MRRSDGLIVMSFTGSASGRIATRCRRWCGCGPAPRSRHEAARDGCRIRTSCANKRPGRRCARDHFAVAAEFALVGRHDLHLPALALGKARVHTQQVAGEQRGFTPPVPARISRKMLRRRRVLRQQRNGELLVEAINVGLRGLNLPPAPSPSSQDRTASPARRRDRPRGDVNS